MIYRKWGRNFFPGNLCNRKLTNFSSVDVAAPVVAAQAVEVVQQDRCRSSLNRKARRKSKMKILKKTEAGRTWAYKNTVEQVFTEDTKKISGLLLHRKDEE